MVLDGLLKGPRGDTSSRRFLAVASFIAAVAVPIAMACILKGFTWPMAAVAGGFLVSMVILLFFTTWADVASIIASWKGRKE